MTTADHIQRLEAILAVGIGGFAGSNLRYFVELLVPASLVATGIANVCGCLALGFLQYEELYSDTVSRSGRTLLATGFLGSFTTYSTFVIDAITTTPLVAGGYIVASYMLGFAAVLAGREGARRLVGTDQSTEGI